MCSWKGASLLCSFWTAGSGRIWFCAALRLCFFQSLFQLMWNLLSMFVTAVWTWSPGLKDLFLEPMILFPVCIVQQGACGMVFLDAILALVLWDHRIPFSFPPPPHLPSFFGRTVTTAVAIVFLFFGVCGFNFPCVGGAWKTSITFQIINWSYRVRS